MSDAFEAGRDMVRCIAENALGEQEKEGRDPIDVFEERVRSMRVETYRNRQKEMDMLLESKMSIHQCDMELKEKNVLLRLNLNLDVEEQKEEEGNEDESDKETKKSSVISDTIRNTSILNRACETIREILSRGARRVVIVTSMHNDDTAETPSLGIIRDKLEHRLGNPINFDWHTRFVTAYLHETSLDILATKHIRCGGEGIATSHHRARVHSLHDTSSTMKQAGSIFFLEQPRHPNKCYAQSTRA